MEHGDTSSGGRARRVARLREGSARSSALLWAATATVGLAASICDVRAVRAQDARAQGIGRQSGVQISPDGKRVLISKDVGDERWAITLNDDNTVTGNVFPQDGGPPQFVWCEPAAEAQG